MMGRFEKHGEGGRRSGGMAKKLCELCQTANASEMFFGVELCKNCYETYNKAVCGDSEAVKVFCAPNAFPNATNRARTDVIDLVKRKEQKRRQEEAAERKKIEDEQKRQEFAKSFNEFYEYDVVTIINANHGAIDKEHMMKVLADHAAQGWKLHSVYSNELGKNALSVIGLGVNSTACEDVLIFERRVERS